MTDRDAKGSASPEHLLGIDQKVSARKHSMLWLGLAIVLVMFLLVYAIGTSNHNLDTQYKTAEVIQGDLVISVTATGKLEPVNQLDVGTEVSGTVESVEVDYNDQVKVGQVLARLDTEQLEAELRQSQASLDLAKARVKEAEATITEMRNRHQRCQKLAENNLTSREECDAAEAAYKRSQAAHASAMAQVTQARAKLDADQTALGKAVIHSPVNGIVLRRSVEPGQTVAASFQAPVLFTLAEDLSRMELHVDIDEADVGQVKLHQQASFTVDAYPDRRFSAQILKVHYAPQVVQDVVTYEAMLSVDNSELLLRPGMTATADIIVRKVNNSLLVPNAALRFTPEPSAVAERSVIRSILPGPPGRPEKQRKVVLSEKTQQQVWIMDDDTPVSIPVTIGATDGRMTEILDGELESGMLLLVDVIRSSK